MAADKDPTILWKKEFPSLVKLYSTEGMIEMARLSCSIRQIEPSFENMHNALKELDTELLTLKDSK